MKIVVTTLLNFNLLRKTLVSEWSQTWLNEILQQKRFSSFSHNTSSITVLIPADSGINHVIYSHAYVFHFKIMEGQYFPCTILLLLLLIDVLLLLLLVR